MGSSGEKKKKNKRTSPPILKTIDTTELCGTMANVTSDNLTYNPCPGAGVGAGASSPPPAAAGSPRETTRLNNLATIPEIGRILAQSQQLQKQYPLLSSTLSHEVPKEGKGMAIAVAPAVVTRSAATENEQNVGISSTHLVSKLGMFSFNKKDTKNNDDNDDSNFIKSGLGKSEEGKVRIAKAKRQDKLNRREERKRKKKKKKKSSHKDDNNNKKQQPQDNAAATASATATATVTPTCVKGKMNTTSRSDPA